MRYVWRDGAFRDPKTGEPMPVSGSAICAPHIVSDIPTYRSPIDGRPITSRSQRREDLKRNNCVDARDFPSPVKDGFKNPRFAAKHGFELGDRYRG